MSKDERGRASEVIRSWYDPREQKCAGPLAIWWPRTGALIIPPDAVVASALAGNVLLEAPPVTPEREADLRRSAILEEQQKLALAAHQRAQEEARKRQLAEAVAARAKELEAWQRRIHDRIHSKVVVPPATPDNVEAKYEIVIIPGGEVLSIQLKKSSGQPAYDAAIERAINSASPLPVPSDPGLFQQLRTLNLVFRPN